MRFTNNVGLLGYDNESNSRSLKFEIESELTDCNIYIDFELPNGTKYKSAMLTDRTKYVLPQALSQKGWLKCQLVAYRGDTFICKSNVVAYLIDDSINATQDIVDNQGDVINALQNGKADDLSYSNNILQLMANGQLIGDPITIAGGGVEELIGTRDNPIYFINLQSGIYLLSGMGKPFDGADITGYFDKQFIQVFRYDGYVYLLLFDTLNIQTEQYAIDVAAVTYTRTVIDIKQMALHIVPTDYHANYFIPILADQQVNMESSDITSSLIFSFNGIDIPLNYYNKCVFRIGTTIPHLSIMGAPNDLLWVGDSVNNNQLVLQANTIYTIEFSKDTFNLIAKVTTR